MSLGVLLLAAGQSRRFGSADKLLAPLAGRPVIARALDALALPEAAQRLAVVSTDPVAVIARQAGFGTLAVAPGLPQADSLTAGLGWLRQRGITRLLVALGDMPWLEVADMRALLNLGKDQAACAALGATPMPPALFPARMFDALAGLSGDRGAGRLLQSIPASRRLALPPERLRDIDTPADLPAG